MRGWAWALPALLAVGCGSDGAPAGTPPGCAVSAPEDCFNGVDDDCNGLGDCDDPSCIAFTECVPAAGAFALGVEVAPDEHCPTHYASATQLLGQGPGAAATCAGCRCEPQLICTTTLHALPPDRCSGAPSADVALDSASCNGGPSEMGLQLRSGNLRVDPMTPAARCAPSGTPAPPPVTWHARTRFCATAQVGAGCPGGFVCVARTSAKHCALADGEAACTGGYRVESGGAWYAGARDQRSCGGACTCAAPTGASCGDSRVATSASSTACQYPSLSLPPGDHCGLPPSDIDSAGVVLRDATPPRCAVANTPSGSLEASERRTLCCWDGGPP